MSSISSDDEDEDVAEALNTALVDVSTVSLMCSNIENNENTVQSHEPSRKTRKRPRSPLPVIEGATPVSLPSSGGFNGLGIESIIKEPSKVMWRQQSMQLHINNVAFQGDSSLPSKITDLKTPFQLLCYFLNSDIISIIVKETMRAALKDNIANKFKITTEDIHHYIGILIYISLP
ncbi:uncharacterized protein LOC124462031 [Drosophila willistoni]|uniref:uncharacterized protein LOC124462031 n=1 Tax=Drosophila willistoni TaxID=7260 RepID=UPI001F0828D0|nr:uncharacterized protein LOC124462031 [Drosophila willistoni]